jgi:hypothetical protein
MGRRRARQIAKIASERDRALRAHWFNLSKEHPARLRLGLAAGSGERGME